VHITSAYPYPYITTLQGIKAAAAAAPTAPAQT